MTIIHPLKEYGDVKVDLAKKLLHHVETKHESYIETNFILGAFSIFEQLEEITFSQSKGLILTIFVRP